VLEAEVSGLHEANHQHTWIVIGHVTHSMFVHLLYKECDFAASFKHLTFGYPCTNYEVGKSREKSVEYFNFTSS
jgi:hypothetical protein